MTSRAKALLTAIALVVAVALIGGIVVAVPIAIDAGWLTVFEPTPDCGLQRGRRC
jgi:hypothetical protein